MIKCKRIISIAMLLVMMATMFSVDVFAGSAPSTPDYLICGDCGKGVTYEFNTYTKELKILGKGEIKDFKELGNAYSSIGLSVAKGAVGMAVTGLSSAGSVAIANSRNLSQGMKTGINIGASIAVYVVGQLLDSGIDTIKNKKDTAGTVPWRDYLLEIKSVKVSEGITKIGKNTFAYLSNLTDVKIENSVKKVDIGAFNGCTNLTSITMGNGVNQIEAYAFCGCTNLTSITIGEEVKQIEAYAFCGCNNLSNVTYNGKSDINSVDSFSMCPLLQEVKVPSDYEGDTFCGIKVVKECV